MKFTIEFPEAGLGLNLDCNNEIAYGPEQFAQLRTCVRLLLSGQCHTPTELDFIKDWMEAGFLPRSLKAEWQGNALRMSDSALTRKFSSELRLLRDKCTDSSRRATAYKHLFAAALSSGRRIEKLLPLMTIAREILVLDITVATLIADAIAAEHPAYPLAPARLNAAEREAILAMAMIVLRVDEQKHVLELPALREVMLALDITTADNAHLWALAKQGMTKLIAGLSPVALPTALLNILRIVVADRSVHQRERHVVIAISNRMANNEVMAIQNVVMLESGTRFVI